MDLDAVRKLIQEKLDDLDLDAKALSLRIGKSHSYISQFLTRGIPKELGERDREAIAQILGVNERLLRGPSPKLPKKEYAKPGGTVADTQPDIKMSDTGHIRLDNQQKIAQISGDRDLPVFDTEQSDAGTLMVAGKVAKYAVRPEALIGVLDGYGMIITGDAMSPRIEHGDTVMVDPHAKAKSGSACVFRSRKDGGKTAFLARLRRFTEESWFVCQSNPERDFQIKRSEWYCHWIASINPSR